MKEVPIFDAQTLENGRKLFCEPCGFVLGVANLNQLPESNLNEVAFAGRSNVGKSSLLNALFNRSDLAKTSSTPGRTQQLNFFNINDKIHLVDLPGYGFAKAPTDEVKKWQSVIFTYLRGRPNLRRVFLLIDSRHGLKKVDTDIMKMLDEAAVTYQLVFTKADKVSHKELLKAMHEAELIIKSHPAAHSLVLYTSSEKKKGLENVRAEIAMLV